MIEEHTSDEPSFAQEDRNPPSLWERPGMALPKTVYVWLVLLILSFIAPAIIPKEERRVVTGKEATLSATDFSDLVSAETKVRSAFGIDASQRKMETMGDLKALGGLTGNVAKKNEKQRNRLLGEAVKTFRDLEKSQHTPGLSRRVFVIEHAMGKPLDETLLTKDLADALKQDKETPEQIATEQRLWRSLYGATPSVSASDLPTFERLVNSLPLHFLKDRVLFDLYSTAGDKAKAATYQSAFDQAMLRNTGAQFALGTYVLFVFLAGIVFLILFLVAARTGHWQNINRVATQPQRLGWGDLLDVFVFYLVLVKGVGLLLGVVMTRLDANPDLKSAPIIEAVFYIVTGLMAAAYLALTIRRRGATFADIGLRTTRSILSEIGYGIAGYCAAIPLVFALGGLSHLIFRHDQTRTPNPILPLIAVENDPFSRVIIFLLVSFGAPIFEELFFRGVLFSGLRTRLGWVASAAVSGIVFAMLHPMQDWLPIFGLGFALATMREMRQSLIPGMTAHFLQNSLAFLSLSVLFSN